MIMEKHTNYIKGLILLMAVVMAVTINGCTKEEFTAIETQSSEYISFVTSFSRQTKSASEDRVSGYLGITEEEWRLNAEAVETKTSPVQTLDGMEAGVTGYLFAETWSDNLKSWAPDLTNKKFLFVDNNLTAAADSVKWSEIGGSGKIRIYAYAPYGLISGTTEITGEPVINYTVPDLAKDQKDIIAAVSSNYDHNYRKQVPLIFNHCLTAIRFKAGFDCTIKSITINGAYASGSYIIGGEWTGSGSRSFTIDFGSGKSVSSQDMITDGENTLMLIPQTLGTGAEVVVVYNAGQTIRASLAGMEWKPGKLITYTLNQEISSSQYTYFDLAAGNVDINANNYTGYVFVNGDTTLVTGVHKPENKYYVYQSSDRDTKTNRINTGWKTAIGDAGGCRVPVYGPVMYKGQLWSEYITDNSVVEDVIEAWDNKANTAGASVDAKRTPTLHKIHITGEVETCNLTIDNIYSRYQTHGTVGRTTGGIAYLPSGKASSLRIYTKGDNRVGCVHYANTSQTSGHKIIFEGTGSLTAADVNFRTDFFNDRGGGENIGVKESNEHTYFSNHWMSAIGNNDGNDHCYGIFINSGVIYAGTTKAENCSALGGGGNGMGEVTINGGTVTAVATTTGTAIGGGIGFYSAGGQGWVTITGGNVYAYNHANRWDVPSSAIGGAGSFAANGNIGKVTITGGNVYAQSAIGTAIGGGSSANAGGGGTEVTITGGNVIAKSIAAESGQNPGVIISGGAGIGGGSGCVSGSKSNYHGGNAKIRISGNPVIRTGSIGGGITNSPGGFIGSADIEITGGDIQAQFIMAAGSNVAPVFKMNGGIIRDSDVDDPDYAHVRRNGGAVYMENGVFTMTSGLIKNCKADNGGAIYIKGDNLPEFIMKGGQIQNCSSTENGGAVYLEDGKITLSGGSISKCAGKNGGGVYILKTSEITPEYEMSGGNIDECAAEYDGGALYLEGGKVTLQSGDITGNLTHSGNGGGINIKAGDFHMIENGTAVISGNSAQFKNGIGGDGGGLYISSSNSNVSVNILSGTITGNSANRFGGGVAVDMSASSTYKADVIVGTADEDNENPDISLNEAGMMGGGLYVIGKNANVTINSGKIIQNRTSAYVYNVDVANEKGMVALNGGNVVSVTVTFHTNGNNATFSTEGIVETAQQKIVTSTNSLLNQPAYIYRPGYKFIKWHTRKDGDDTKGRSYSNNDVMNLSSSIDLYAQWQML